MLKINWKHKNWKFKLGIILMLISLIFFALVATFPITNISKSHKIFYTSISFVLAEVLFYTGGFLLGKELFKKYRSWFNPVNWFKKKPSVGSSTTKQIDVSDK